MTRPADWKQRERALDPERSWIVQAPAGSGKTELLTQRLLGLLAAVEQPEEIVAITFTRKAAAEMRHRLVRQLLAARLPPGQNLQPHEEKSRNLALAALANDAERGWNLLEQPGRLRIRTIDSLCAELARQLPILSGLGGGQKVSDDVDALYHQAATRTMAAIEKSGDELQADIERVLDRYDNQYDRLVSLLTVMLGQRDQWLAHLLDLRAGDGFDRERLETSLRVLVEAELEAVNALMPEDLLTELPALLNYALANDPLDSADLAALLDAAGGANAARLSLPTDADSVFLWVTLVNRLLTADGKNWRKAPDKNAGFPSPSAARGEEKQARAEKKQAFTMLLDRHRDNDALREGFNRLRKLPRPAYGDEAWESLESLLRILLRCAQEWQFILAETGEADYGEIAARAIEALGGEDTPSDLALRLDFRIQHLLVDEFQDTSHSQIRLLERLTAGWTAGDGRSLFLVGDPMQSIYRFRKAEVSLFIRAFEGHLFEHLALAPLRLQVNFRSSLPIVDWVNEVFPSVMPVLSDPIRGAVNYSPSAPRPRAEAQGSVSIHIQPLRDDRLEAQGVLDAIRQCGSAESTVVLVRSRNQASEILALLDRLKGSDDSLRYQAIEFLPLGETPLVQDLVALTLALLQPVDRLAWLTVLRAPWTGLDLSDLEAVAGGDLESVIPATLGEWDSLPLSAPGRLRLERIAPVLLEAASMRGRISVRLLVESAWLRLGGPACLSNESERRDAATYFDLLDTLEAGGLPIDRDTLAERLESLYAEPDALADGHLQVMTIYQAKGLQFDNVILPGLNRTTGSDKGRLLHWFELVQEEERIVLSPMRNADERERHVKGGDLISFVSHVEKQRQALEDGRLLYVAATRAVSRLFLLAAIEPRANGTVAPRSGTLLAELWPAIGAEQAPQILAAAAELPERPDGENDTNEDGSDSNTSGLPQVYGRLTEDWKLPALPDSIEAASDFGSPPTEPIEFRWAGEGARLTGNLVHRLLQQIAEAGVEAWQSGNGPAQLPDWCRRQLLSEGIANHLANPIIRRVQRAIANSLESAKGRWILDSHEDARCEYALTAVLDGRPASLLLDRTFIADGKRWIIDYKTSEHAGGDLEGFLANEEARYRDQLSRYRKALAFSEKRPIHTALYFPLLDRFCEVKDSGSGDDA